MIVARCIFCAAPHWRVGTIEGLCDTIFVKLFKLFFALFLEK